MAPEQLRGHPVTEQCDVYALGATLYHLLSRKPPHHAKTADEMMRSAVRGPPTPIAELVPGVPAELATITEKALAHDAARRYRDARELAEDLQRFLSGQLVASHRYSRRERLVRFVRKNRVPMTVTAAATLTLLVGGTLAVNRIVNERDRAQAAHADALQQDEWRTLEEARREVATDPTRIVAMLKPLAPWYGDEVRTIAAAARAYGVAYGLPGPKQTASLELSRDGARARRRRRRRRADLRSGAAGVALARRRAGRRRAGPVRRRRAPDRRLARPQARDRRRDHRRRPHRHRPHRDRQARGRRRHRVLDRRPQRAVAARSRRRGRRRRARRGPAPRARHPARALPDGRYLALAGRDHLLFLDRTRSAEASEVMLGKTTSLDWSTDGQSFGALVDENGVLVKIDDGAPQIMQRNHVSARTDVVNLGEQLYVLGPTGVGTVSREDLPAPRKQVDGKPVGLREARGGVVIAGSSRRIVVLSPFGDRTLAVPPAPSSTSRRARGRPTSSARSRIGSCSGTSTRWSPGGSPPSPRPHRAAPRPAPGARPAPRRRPATDRSRDRQGRAPR